MMLIRQLCWLGLLLILTACGGGGGSVTSTIPQTQVSPGSTANPTQTTSTPSLPPRPNPTLGANQISDRTSLPQISLATFQNQVLPGTVSNDRTIKVGNIFADLFHDPADPADTFWTVTNRGPVRQLTSPTRQTLPIPTFAPMILQVRAGGGQIQVLQQIPLLTTSSQSVTGIPNLAGVDTSVFNFEGTQMLPTNPNGLDPQGLVRSSDGSFFVAENFSPSISRVSAQGKILQRWVPQGRGLSNTDYPVQDVLPSVLNQRRSGRGFGGLALSSDGTSLFTITQSALSIPNGASTSLSQALRLFKLDAGSGQATAEYVYVQDTIASFTNGRETGQLEIVVSALAFINPTSLLAIERTNEWLRVYQLDLSAATNILGNRFDSLATSPSLETLSPDSLSANGVTPIRKTALIDIANPFGSARPDGLAIPTSSTIALGATNNFDIFDQNGMTPFDSNGNLIPSSPPVINRLFVFRSN